MLTHKAAMDRAARLEQEIADIRERLASAPLVENPNPLGAAMALMIGAAADALTAWQQAVVVAGVFELCLVGVMVIYELLGHNPKSSQHPAAAAWNRWWTRWRASPRAEAAPDATALPPPTRRGNAKGSVEKFINQRVSPADGERLEVKTMLQEYRGWCSSNGVEPVTLRAYLDDVEAVCHKIGIEVVREADRVFCLGMKIEEAAP